MLLRIRNAALQPMTALGLSLVAIVWASVATVLYVEHDTARKAAEQTTKNLARVFEEHVVRAIKETDKTLLFLRAAYEKAPQGFDIQNWVDREYFRNDLTLQLSITGADGLMVSTNLGPITSPIDLSDREHFKVHVNAKSDDLFISKPVLGRASGKWSVQMTRRISRPDGSFGGIIVASIDPYHFSRFYESVDLGPGGAITLVGLDGIIRVRGGVDPAAAIGRSTVGTNFFAQLSKSPVGTLDGEGNVDGVRRILSYRIVKGYPLVVSVGQSESDIYANFYASRGPLLAVGFALTLLVVAVVGIGIRHRLKLDQTNAALHAARDSAEAANQAKSAFLAVMSHEMRTPLNGVIGALDLLQHTGLSGDQSKYVQVAMNSSEALLAHINDVLDFSKMEAGKLALEESAVDVRALVASVLTILKPQANARNNALRTRISDSLPAQLRADPVRLRQILLNFLSNAAKFTQDGEIVVEVLHVDGPSTEPTIEFAVTDTGTGIPANRLSSLFKEFSMVDASYARNAGGTGLGLAICKRLVQAMGGEIGVTSEAGKGSRFWFRVRLHEEAGSEAIDAQSGEPQSTSSAVPPMKILLVDDNATNRMVASHMLAAAGHEVKTAGNGREALAAARDELFDAILMDISMPEMDGLEATRRIRLLPQPHRGVPIVALTANAVAGDEQQFMDAGMDFYMSKPVRRTALEAMLLKIAGRRTNTVLAARHVDAQPYAAPSDEPLVDDAELDRFAAETSPELVPEIITAYKLELDRRLDELIEAAAARDEARIGRLAHAIAGSAASVGAIRLRQTARRLEAACKAGDAVTAGPLITAIPTLAAETSDLLRKRLEDDTAVKAA